MPVQAANGISTNLPLGQGYYSNPSAFDEPAARSDQFISSSHLSTTPSLPASLTPADAWDLVETVNRFVKTRPSSLALNLHCLADPSLLGSNYV